MTDRMARIGTVVLSVDLPAESSTGGRRHGTLAQDLFHMVESRRLAASWVPLATGPFSLRDQLAAPHSRHDVALVGDPSWIGKSAGRTRFARELSERVEALRSAHFKVAAIALRDAQIDDHLDLLVKHRIGMIRGHERGGARLQPRSVRFGVWYSPVSVILPQPSQWSWMGASWSFRQTISRAIRAAGVAHVMIDAARLDANSSALKELDLVLAHLQRQRDRGVLAVTSLSGLAATLIRKPTARHSQSILRAA